MPKKPSRIGEKLSPGLRKIIRNIGWLSVEKILAMFLNLSIGIYVIRYLGADDFGKLSYCFSLVGMFAAIAKLGLDAIVVRDLVQNEPEPEILGTAFVLKLIGSVATILAIAIITLVLNEDWQTYWFTIIIAFRLLFNSTETIDFWFQSKLLSGAIVTIRSIRLILSSAAKNTIYWFRFPFERVYLAAAGRRNFPRRRYSLDLSKTD